MAGGEASVTTRTSSGSVISCRGGPRHGPPHPPTLGRAPAKPWRASKLTQDVSSVDRQHGLARKAAVDQVLRDLTDLLPGALDADVRRELSSGDELSEPPQPDRGGLEAQLLEEIEAVQGRAAADEERARVERHLGAG